MQDVAFGERCPWRWLLENSAHRAKRLRTKQAKREFVDGVEWFAKWHSMPPRVS
jgi:hypothetical protein